MAAAQAVWLYVLWCGFMMQHALLTLCVAHRMAAAQAVWLHVLWCGPLMQQVLFTLFHTVSRLPHGCSASPMAPCPLVWPSDAASFVHLVSHCVALTAWLQRKPYGSMSSGVADALKQWDNRDRLLEGVPAVQREQVCWQISLQVITSSHSHVSGQDQIL
jgi:hypothetical protein